MKKLLCALLISFTILGMVFAEDATTVEPGADNGTTSMQAEVNPATSPSDSESTKAITFDAGKVKLAPEQKIGLPITLNILPGFGIGSFVQHDKLGGSIGVLLSVSAITLGVVGAGFFATGILIAGASSIGGNTADESVLNLSMGLFAGAAALEVGNILWGIFRPIQFRKKYNDAHSLAAAGKPTLTVVPVLATNEYGAVAVVQF
jgi:hypothetical protein